MQEDEEVKVLRSVSGKFAGYCNECNNILCDFDQDGSKYKCNRCGNKIAAKDIKKEREIKRWENKKEYLKGNSGYYGNSFHMNKSTTEYNIDHTSVKKKVVKDDDEENTLD